MSKLSPPGDCEQIMESTVKIGEWSRTETIPKEIVEALDTIFSDVPGVDTVALASLLLKLAGKVEVVASE